MSGKCIITIPQDNQNH